VNFARWVASLLVGLSAALTIYWAIVSPYNLNVQKKFVRLRTVQTLTASEYTSRVMAQQNVVLLNRAMNRFNWDAETMVIRAANFRILLRADRATEDYEKALSFDERPEIHLQLGELHRALGDHNRAQRHFRRAAEFSAFYVEPGQ